jgi:hypothetical protein
MYRIPAENKNEILTLSYINLTAKSDRSVVVVRAPAKITICIIRFFNGETTPQKKVPENPGP